MTDSASTIGKQSGLRHIMAIMFARFAYVLNCSNHREACVLYRSLIPQPGFLLQNWYMAIYWLQTPFAGSSSSGTEDTYLRLDTRGQSWRHGEEEVNIFWSLEPGENVEWFERHARSVTTFVAQSFTSCTTWGERDWCRHALFHSGRRPLVTNVWRRPRSRDFCVLVVSEWSPNCNTHICPSLQTDHKLHKYQSWL